MQSHRYSRLASHRESSTQTADRLALIVLAATTTGLVAIAMAFLP